MSTSPHSDSDPAFDLLCHLVSSARGVPEEGAYTGSLRLIHGAAKLADLMADRDGAADPFLLELSRRIREESTARYLRSPEDFLAFLDDLVRLVAGEIRTRAGLEPAADE